MGLFGRYTQADEASTTASVPTIVEGPGRKGRPTPTRAEAEAARMAALHPKLTKKQAAAQDRAAASERRQKAMAAAEAAPEKVLLRNHVDARWGVLEFAWPVMLLVMATLLLTRYAPIIGTIGGGFLYAFLIVGAVNVALEWRSFKRELAVRVPHASSKGLLMMMISRMTTPRRMRTPGATIKRGGEY